MTAIQSAQTLSSPMRRHVAVARWRAGLIRAGACLALAFAFTLPAGAADIPWRPEPVERMYEQKDLRELLRELAASQGITANVDNDVTGTVFGKFSMPAGKLFQYLVSTYGLIYYYSGNVLQIHPASSAVSEVIQLKRADPQALLRTLSEMGISDRRYPIALHKRERTLIVSGPKQYVDIVRQVAKSVDDNETGRAETMVRVFPLKYAWAKDVVYRDGSRQEVVPGVATVLQRLFPAAGAQQPSRAGTRVAASLAQEPVSRRVRNTDLSIRLPPKLPGAQDLVPGAEGADDDNRGGGGGVSAAGFPQFTPDGRLNAVLIRDVAARMPAYEELIRQLDVRPMLVEIEATIIEVGSNDLSALGIDWRFSSARFDVRSGRNDLPTERSPSTLPVGPAPFDPGPRGNALTGLGGVLTTILTDGGHQFVARVNALAQDGKATFRAAPKVLTLDNVEAALQRMRTFFVRVPGAYTTELFDVSVGTSMRVTPLVVSEGGSDKVKLSVKIEDGEITDQVVDQIPVVTRNTINTQAFVGNGESLLLAGYTEDVKSEGEAGVPGLSKIPVLGYLFKQKDTSSRRIERLFLITPRLLPLPEPEPDGRAR
jgi:type III secretion protein C